MEKGLNFRTMESQNKYFDAYSKSLELIETPVTRKYIDTSYGSSHVVCCGDERGIPLVLLHAASCGSPIWYRNISFLSNYFCVYAIDLISETAANLQAFTPIWFQSLFF